jgi:hypothetical protein
MISWSRFTPVFTNCAKGGTQATISKGKSSHIDLKRAWKATEPKVLTPIASYKNERWFGKNMVAMIAATHA